MFQELHFPHGPSRRREHKLLRLWGASKSTFDAVLPVLCDKVVALGVGQGFDLELHPKCQVVFEAFIYLKGPC